MSSKYYYIGTENLSTLFDRFLSEDLYSQSIDRDCINEQGFVRLTSLAEVKEAKMFKNIWIITP